MYVPEGKIALNVSGQLFCIKRHMYLTTGQNSHMYIWLFC